MAKTDIKDIQLRVVFTGKGTKTIEAEVISANGRGRAVAPSGTSAGSHEALAFPSKPEQLVKRAQDELIPELLGQDATQQKKIDNIISVVDNTKNFSHIGGSVAIAISTAALKCAASCYGKELFQYLNPKAKSIPKPLGKVFGGGTHTLLTTSDIQEILVLPKKNNAKANIEIMQNIQSDFGAYLKNKKIFAGRDLEGGWTAEMSSEQVLDIVKKLADKHGANIGLDIAASEFYKNNKYRYIDGRNLNAEEQKEYVKKLISKYKIKYVEDPFHEDDFESFAALTKEAKGCIICGDDLFTTNPYILQKGIGMKAANAIIIKPNQIGTITETLRTVEIAKRQNYQIVFSHRSGDTCDTAISQLAVGTEAQIIKCGIIGGERTSKLNELIRIEETLKH
ncbi:MAG: hypothetical protein JXA43_00680 [Candidatus Diapherotrites archaeon]|nr:hypothetical protein [Candidatus Diapherotrites archaeon]